jgi:hypothetical protein
MTLQQVSFCQRAPPVVLRSMDRAVRKFGSNGRKDGDIVLFNAAEGDAWRPMLLAHLLSLGPDARRARFNATCHDHNIETYVAGVEPGFVLFLQKGGKVAACAEIHVTDRTAPGGAVAEVALSVVDAQQGQRLGSRLMVAMELVSAKAEITTLMLYFDSGNLPMQRLAMHRKPLRDYVPTRSATGARLNARPAGLVARLPVSKTRLPAWHRLLDLLVRSTRSICTVIPALLRVCDSLTQTRIAHFDGSVPGLAEQSSLTLPTPAYVA